MHTRTPIRPTQAAVFFHVLFSKVLWWHFSLSAGPLWEPRKSRGEEERRAAWSRCLLVRGQRTPPSPSLLLSFALSPAFIGRASKWRSAYEKGPVFMPRKLAYHRPSPTHFTKTPSHLCHVREGRPSSAGSPLFLSSLFSSFSARRAFQPLKLWLWGEKEGEEGARISHSQIKRKRGFF